MSGFSAEWLLLREPCDRAARSARLARRFAALLPPAPLVVDLGGGTGSNIRALESALPLATRWRLVDADAVLLREARRILHGPVTFRPADLAQPRALAAALDRSDAVTTAALLDLVSADWIDTLFALLARRRLPLLAVLTVDESFAITPRHRDDAAVRAAFARDQARDKGFGPALGARAVAHLRAAARAHGYRVESAASPWRIDKSQRAMLEAMIDGIAAAARATEPVSGARWRTARRQAIAAERLAMTVGHRDVLAYPARRA